MKTLILIDIQNDFCPGGTLPVPGGDTIIPVINKMEAHFDLVVATQDWHPPNHISFASNHEGKKLFDTIQIDAMEQTLWPDHCLQGSIGAQFHPGVAMHRVEAIFRKGTNSSIDSYSGFYDNGHKKKTGLSGYLKDRQAFNLFFCGLAADVCVYYSIKDALQEGFSVTLVEDATKPINEEFFHKIKKELSQSGVSVITSDALSRS